MQGKAARVWLICLIAGSFVEGVWFFLAVCLGGWPIPVRFALLAVLWLPVVISLFFFERAPILCVVAAWINFVGCAVIKTMPTNVPHPAFHFLYAHSVDMAIIIFAHLAYSSRSRMTITVS